MKEKKDEREDEILVLDEGIDIETIAGSLGNCCTGSLAPFR